MTKEECPFCKIVAGEISTEQVYADEYFMAFMDINPETPGHIQIIPKRHYRWVWDLPSREQALAGEASISDYFEIVKHLADAQRKAFNTDWIISKVVGDEVPHAHVWLFPSDSEGDKNNLAENAERIRTALSN